MSKVRKDKVHSVSIFIQWREDEVEAGDVPCQPKVNTTTQSRREAKVAAPDGGKRNRSRNVDNLPLAVHMLATDRIVLDALRARVLPGEQMTTPVRIRELMAACTISRRQVQICLKRLNEKGLIKRVIEGVVIGSQDGYCYLLS